MLQKLKQARPAFWKMALSLPIIAALVFVYSCQKSEVENIQPEQRAIASAKSASNPFNQYLDKYRAKYPNISIDGIGSGLSEDGSITVLFNVENVPNETDRLKIEAELRPIITKIVNDLNKQLKEHNEENLRHGGIFQLVEDQPSPAGGYEAFYRYIGENIQYPQQARLKGIEGKVFVQFVVYNDGSIGDVQVLKGIGEGCDEEAAKVIANSPKWVPGKQDGKPVNVRMSVPIAFKLD